LCSIVGYGTLFAVCWKEKLFPNIIFTANFCLINWRWYEKENYDFSLFIISCQDQELLVEIFLMMGCAFTVLFTFQICVCVCLTKRKEMLFIEAYLQIFLLLLLNLFTQRATLQS
jgi:hypothetical protein